MTKKAKTEEQQELPLIRKPHQKRERVTAEQSGEILTEQSHKDQCNINMIVARARRTGMAPGQAKPPQFMDCPAIDYHQAMNVVTKGEQAFMQLPASVRRMYRNDPGMLLEAIRQSGKDSELRQELEELGVLEPLEAASGQHSAQEDDLGAQNGEPQGKGQNKPQSHTRSEKDTTGE